MQINNLPASNITQAKPSATAAVADPPKPAPAAKPPVVKAPEAKAPPEPKKPEAEGSDKKPEISDVKSTGETTPEGEPTFTLKVNGKDVVATQSEIISLAQKAQGAESAMKKLAEIEKLTSNLLSNFDSDVFSLMVQRHGREKAKEMAIAMVRNLIAEEEKSPEQRRVEELETENKRFKDAQELEKKQKEEGEQRLKQRELYGRMLREIDTELDQTHLPKDKLTLTRVLNYLSAGKKANGATWTIKDAVRAVEVEDMSHATHYAKRYVEGKLPSEKFVEIFGKDALKKLNKDQIDLLKNADKSAKNEQPKPESGGAAPAVEPARRRTLSRTKGSDGISEREYRKQFGSLGGI